MIHICICDDEKVERINLKTIINTQLELKGIDFSIVEYENGEALIESLSKSKNYFDIIFLDIEMKGLNGIEIARHIRKSNDTSIIIFITGFSEYVFNGYEVKALNYILKPYKQDKIIEVLNEALKQINSNEDKFFIVQINSNSYKICLKDIYYFISDKRKLKIVTIENTYEFYGKLDDIEKELPSFFIRVHQRYLININYISSIENSCVEVNKEKIPISRQKYQNVMIAFAKAMLK